MLDVDLSWLWPEQDGLWILFLSLLGLTVVTVLSYLAYSGLFTTVVVKTQEAQYGPMVVAYKSSTGPYRECGALFTESYCLLPDKEQIGIFYDDPDAVPENELRYAVGPVLANGVDEKPSPLDIDNLKKNGFRVAYLPKPNFAVVASFPFRTTLSIYLATFKVYPKLKSYITSHNLCAYPAVEIYRDSEIVFMMPLSRQDEFFVPEFEEDDISVATTEASNITHDNLEDQRMSKTPQKTSPKRDKAGFIIPKTPDLAKPAGKGKKEKDPRKKRSRSPSRQLTVDSDDQETTGDEDSVTTTSSFEDIGKEMEQEVRDN